MKHNIKNSAEGAYWCTNYEVPANADTESITRGNRAKTKYWPMFSSGANDVIYTTANVNVRSAANTNSKVLGTLQKGSYIAISGYSNGWYKVNYSGEIGYINAAYTSTIPNGTNVVSTFDDIKGTEWFVPAIQYVYDHKIMTGTSISHFSPTEKCSRASVAVMIKNYPP